MVDVHALSSRTLLLVNGGFGDMVSPLYGNRLLDQMQENSSNAGVASLD
jgi:hypothetical protein